MAHEYPTGLKVLRLVGTRRRWSVEFNGRQSGHWGTVDAAALAASRHATGLPEWDQSGLYASADILDWRPTGESL